MVATVAAVVAAVAAAVAAVATAVAAVVAAMSAGAAAVAAVVTVAVTAALSRLPRKRRSCIYLLDKRCLQMVKDPLLSLFDTIQMFLLVSSFISTDQASLQSVGQINGLYLSLSIYMTV